MTLRDGRRTPEMLSRMIAFENLLWTQRLDWPRVVHRAAVEVDDVRSSVCSEGAVGHAMDAIAGRLAVEITSFVAPRTSAAGAPLSELEIEALAFAAMLRAICLSRRLAAGEGRA